MKAPARVEAVYEEPRSFKAQVHRAPVHPPKVYANKRTPKKRAPDFVEMSTLVPPEIQAPKVPDPVYDVPEGVPPPVPERDYMTSVNSTVNENFSAEGSFASAADTAGRVVVKLTLMHREI